jgi:hypothetical protein
MGEKSACLGVKMHYQGPSPADLDNIRALNRCYLGTLAASDREVMPPASLSESERLHLGRAPFLLFSFREAEEDFWKHLLSQDRQLELIGTAPPLDAGTRALQVAGLSFLWQLSCRNPYVVRLVTGAPVSWCERVAGLTLIGLLDRTSHRTDLLTPRFRHQGPIWQRLLTSGTSGKVRLRNRSHRSVLQAMLTSARPVNYERLQAAAASLPTPKRRGNC